MPDELDDITPRISGGGGQVDLQRPVYAYDLENATLRIENKLAMLRKDIAESAKNQAAYEAKTNKNEEEIGKIRAHVHDISQVLTVQQSKTAALTPELITELIRLIPAMIHLEKIAEKREMTDVLAPDELLWVRSEKAIQERRQRLDEQVSIGRRVQSFIAPSALMLFGLYVLEQILAKLPVFHP